MDVDSESEEELDESDKEFEEMMEQRKTKQLEKTVLKSSERDLLDKEFKNLAIST